MKRGVQLTRANLTSKNTLYSDNNRLFHIVIQAKKDLSLNFIDRTREWHNGLFFDQNCMWTYKLTIGFWLNIVKLSQNGRQTTKYTVYKHTDIFKTWTDRQMASRRHGVLRASLTISGSTTPPQPSSTRGSPPARRKKKFRLDCHECLAVPIGVKLPHKCWTPP